MHAHGGICFEFERTFKLLLCQIGLDTIPNPSSFKFLQEVLGQEHFFPGSNAPVSATM